MTIVQKLASFVVKSSYDQLSETARLALKVRILDGFGCAIRAIDARPMRMVKAQLDDFGGALRCGLIGGGMTAPDRAAFYNSALVRYLDFNDAYLAKHETCHPSDNLGAVLAASEYANRSGRDFMAALAVAYQVQCRLSDVAPVRDRGFDHTTQGAYAVAAGVSRALGLDDAETANAIAISGTSYNSLRVLRTGTLSNWKGLAYPNTAMGATHAAFLAMRGITGPSEVFEGNKGFMDAIAGRFEIDWEKEDLERVAQTVVKKYNAEIHSQSALEGILELKHQNGLSGSEIKEARVDIFDVAYKIIGGGEEGDKTMVRTKEQADHSLPYMLAVAMLDDQVMPEQYSPERITRDDVQTLLRKIKIYPNSEYSQRFPNEMACKITVSLVDSRAFSIEKNDYEGFRSRPMKWETAVGKFERLAARNADQSLKLEIIDAVRNLENIDISDLMGLLARVSVAGGR